MKLKNLIFLTIPLWGMGCYTQFATLDYSPPSEKIVTMVDSTGDTVKVIKQVDTIVSKENETCIWVRDLTGYPRLRCYSTNYSRDWLFYSNTPWWYRNDPFWYDYERCPRFYYYDPAYGCCRYYKDYRYPYRRDHDSDSDSPSEPSYSSPSRASRSQGVPGKGTASSAGNSTSLKKVGNSKSSSGKIEIPTASPSRTSRSLGVPDAGSSEKVKIPLNKSASVPVQKTDDSKVDAEKDKKKKDSNTNKRRNPRSW